MSSRQIIALIVAAGQSRRMGRPKLLMRYRDSTILETVISSVLESSVDGLVVVANQHVAEFLGGDFPERAFVARNDDPATEMIDSVKIGVARIRTEFSTGDDDGVLLLLGDQPQVGGGVITTCAEAYRLPQRPPGILVATCRGRRGHPTVFSMAMLRAIDDWGSDRGLNELARQHPEQVREVPLVSGPRPIDVNTPEDYDRLMDSI